MSYLVLARKYRPADFEGVIGQEHITDLLKSAITSKRLAHAYLFCGPRGIGKTSCARILAKSLNCQKGPTLTPCGECSACKEITQGNSFDVLEIDGASNRGIDEIRTLRENVKFAPSFGRYKIYIVDEVHMLTMEAFNALLKTLEEPPEHVKFILATTDPNKVPATIISRCQRFDFKRITSKTIIGLLTEICKKEKLQIESEAFYAIAKAAQGSFRDALSILDQVSSLSERTIKDEDVYSMLGLVEVDLLFALAEALAEKNCVKALTAFETIIDKGKDIKQLNRDLVEHFRNLMIIKVGGKSLGRMVDYPVAIKEMYLTQAEKFSLPEILKSIDVFIETQEIARITESLRTPLEVAFAKLTYPGQKSAVALATGANAAATTTLSSSPPARPEKTAPAISKAIEKESVAPKVSSSQILKNQKGQVSIAVEEEAAEEDVTGPVVETWPASGGSVDLAKIRDSWDALTYAVSREKMSVATYLQEGFPYEFKDERLTIGFAPQLHFHKESLESKENVLLAERIFSEKLRAKILVSYKTIADAKPLESSEEEPVVKSVLDTFKGKIVSKWHNE